MGKSFTFFNGLYLYGVYVHSVWSCTNVDVTLFVHLKSLRSKHGTRGKKAHSTDLKMKLCYKYEK